ncbi:MAG: RbsD/FucU domain-containing protein [Acidobacteriaceae bacterium]
MKKSPFREIIGILNGAQQHRQQPGTLLVMKRGLYKFRLYRRIRMWTGIRTFAWSTPQECGDINTAISFSGLIWIYNSRGNGLMHDYSPDPSIIRGSRSLGEVNTMKSLLALPLLIISWLPLNATVPNAWRTKIQQELPLLGHRNWIVIVDSAYPWQTSPGVETIETGTDQITVVQDVLNAIHQSNHVRPVVFMDAELPFVTNQEAPGVTQYRQHVKAALGVLPVHLALHEQLIHEMNQSGGTFHILILKTTLTIPYTSVFLRLDCKYWSDASEKKLRNAMKNRASVPPSFGSVK